MRPLCYIRSIALLFSMVLLLTCCIPVGAKPGDTTTIRTFDEYLWTWNGGQNRWGVFPDSTHSYERVLMHYRLKCPTGGCGEWDYTTNVYIMHHTGRIDSSLQTAPSFRVDGKIQDTLRFSTTPTVKYTYNASTKKVDTTENTPLALTVFNDPNDVWRQTDSLSVWPAGYYNPIFDANGNQIDSMYVAPDSVWYATQQDVYVPFEVVEPFEIGRFITPYGKWFAKDREFDWVFDVTDYSYLLHDSVEIRAFYDGWSQGSLFTLDFEVIEGTPAVEVYRIENLYTGGFRYGDASDPIENHLPAKKITIDPESQYTRLKITTSGHGFGGTDNAAEFSDKTHWVEVDGVRRFDQHLWRNDCGQNPVSPQAGTWYFNRAGWCPGDIVHPFIYDLTSYVQPGEESTIDYNMQPYTNTDPSHPATYIVQAQILYAKAPSFTNDAEIAAIERPNDDFMYRRMNPICSYAEPQIVVRNNGKATLTSLNINYSVGNQAPQTYEWHAGPNAEAQTLRTTTVSLPGIDLGSGDNTFTVSISNPNGSTDEQPQNNTMTTSYTLPKSYSGVIYLAMKTDNFANDPETTNGITYQVVDLGGKVLYEKGGFADGVIVRDTFRLPNGCYNFIIRDDYVGDGLLPIQGATGSYQLKDDQGKTIINGASAGPDYGASFGDRAVTPFIVTGSSGVGSDESPESGELLIYPNPTEGLFTLALPSTAHGQPATVQAYSASGEEVFTRSVASALPTMALDFSTQANGIYMVKVTSGDVVWGKKVVVNGK